MVIHFEGCWTIGKGKESSWLGALGTFAILPCVRVRYERQVSPRFTPALTMILLAQNLAMRVIRVVLQ
jgi:hypothetical protein